MKNCFGNLIVLLIFGAFMVLLSILAPGLSSGTDIILFLIIGIGLIPWVLLLAFIVSELFKPSANHNQKKKARKKANAYNFTKQEAETLEKRLKTEPSSIGDDGEIHFDTDTKTKKQHQAE